MMSESAALIASQLTSSPPSVTVPPVKGAVGQTVDLTYEVVNNGPSDGDAFTVVDVLPIEVSVVDDGPCAEAPAGTVTCTGPALALGADVDFTFTVRADMATTPVNTASIDPAPPTDPDVTNNSGSVGVTIEPGSLFSDVAAGDPDWQNQIDGVDVMFAKSGTSTYTLKATNPGTFKYRLSLENETGIDIHVKGKQLPSVIRRGTTIKDANGGSTTVFLTVPSMPSSTGTPIPGGINVSEPAFQLTGWKPVQAHPDDRSDDLPIRARAVAYPAMWSPFPADSTPDMRALIPIALASLLACSPGARASSVDGAAEASAGIDSLNARISRAYRDHDPQAYAALFTDTAVFEWPAFNTVRGRAGLASMARDNWASLSSMDLTLDVSTRRIDANHATECGAFQQSFTDTKGARMVEYGRYVHYLVRDDSAGWRIDRFAGFADSTKSVRQ